MRPWCYLFVLLFACAPGTQGRPVRSIEPQQTSPRLLTPEQLDALPNLFPTFLEPPSDPAFFPMYERLGELRNPELTGDLVSKLFYLPNQQISVVVKQCNVIDAYYNHDTRSITLCYEILRYANELAGKSGAELYMLDRDALITLLFITLHEMGHALLDLLQLPKHASDEDMADQFAFLILTSTDDTALVTDLIKAPATYLHHHGQDMAGHPDPTGVHRPGEERAFVALCLLYGRQRNPAVGQALGDDAEHCVTDTARVVDAWNRALAPYTRLASGRAF